MTLAGVARFAAVLSKLSQPKPIRPKSVFGKTTFHGAAAPSGKDEERGMRNGLQMLESQIFAPIFIAAVPHPSFLIPDFLI
ncbi:MAG: hypothetical protein ACK4Q5_08715 [Saprospiraceae bacterium]